MDDGEKTEQQKEKLMEKLREADMDPQFLNMSFRSECTLERKVKSSSYQVQLLFTINTKSLRNFSPFPAPAEQSIGKWNKFYKHFVTSVTMHHYANTQRTQLMQVVVLDKAYIGGRVQLF